MKNNKNKFSLILSAFLLFVLTGTLILSFSIPNKVLIPEDEKNESFLPKNYSWLFRVDKTKGTQVLSNSQEPIEEKKENFKIYFCGIIPLKTVEVTRAKTQFVCLGGDAIGINLEIDGVLVVGLTPVKSGGVSPAKKAGITVGDIIKKVNSVQVTRTSQVSEIILSSDGPVIIEAERNGKKMTFSIEPLEDEKGRKKAGLWVRDTVSGIGTLTFFTDKSFGALGHPVSDSDTGLFVTANGGSACKASIVGVEKGQKGSAGSLCGIFTSEKIAEIEKNTDAGVFGVSNMSKRDVVAISPKEEIECSDAQILCDIGSGVQSFDAQILRILPSGEMGKGLVIEITDKKLIEKTGGIVQGM